MVSPVQTAVRDRPAYTIAEAARYVRVPLATLRAWVAGRPYRTAGGPRRFEPLIATPDRGSSLSFSNLIEAHVLKALRGEHGVQMRAVRQAIQYAEQTLAVTRLLLRPELMTTGGDLVIEHYGELLNLTNSGQMAIKTVLHAYVRRIDRDPMGFPVRLHPIVDADRDGIRHIALDPRLAFGRPILVGSGVSTAAIAARIDAGESVGEIAEDYGIHAREIEEAVVYERAA